MIVDSKSCLYSTVLYEHLIHCQSEKVGVIKWTYRLPNLYWLLCVEWLPYFEHIVQFLKMRSSIVCILRSTPNHRSLKHNCPIHKLTIKGLLTLD